MKRININRDVESRQNIASMSRVTEPIVEPIKVVEDDGKSEELQGSKNDQKDDQSLPTPQKRGRKTKGDVEEVSL